MFIYRKWRTKGKERIFEKKTVCWTACISMSLLNWLFFRQKNKPFSGRDSNNLTIYNIIRWFARSMEQKTRRLSVWRSKYFFFIISYRLRALKFYVYLQEVEDKRKRKDFWKKKGFGKGFLNCQQKICISMSLLNWCQGF